MTHNAHMLIPKALWNEAKKIAEAEEKHMTQLMCEGLRLVLASRKHQKEDQDGITNAQAAQSSD